MSTTKTINGLETDIVPPLSRYSYIEPKEHFNFLGTKITEKQINSNLPFYNCQQSGHQNNLLDMVCLDPSCTNKGLACMRCVYYKHQEHNSKVVQLNRFIGDLVRNQTDKREVLIKEQQQCRNEFEDSMIQSDVLVHKILSKQHIRRDHFTKYVRDIVESLPKELETGYGGYEREYILKDYEKAFKISNSFMSEMQTVAKELKFLLQDNLNRLKGSIELQKLSANIPQFDMGTMIEQRQFQSQFRHNMDDIFGSKGQSIPTTDIFRTQQKDSIDKLLRERFPVSQTMPRLPQFLEYQSSENFACSVQANRKKVILGRLFQTVVSTTIMKLSTLKTGMTDISCVCVISDDLVSVCGRFSPFIEIYKVSDRSIVGKIDTQTTQGVQCLLVLRPLIDSYDENEGQYQPILLAGTYSDESNILGFKLDILRKHENQIAFSFKTSQKYEQKVADAVTCLEQLYSNDFFVAGYSSGSIAIFHCENSIPLAVLPNIFEKSVSSLLVVEPGKFFVSVSEEQMRFHVISELSESQVDQKVTTFYSNNESIASLLITTGLTEEGSYLKFTHFLIGDFQTALGEVGFLRFVRMVQGNVKLHEEAANPIFASSEFNNSIKDLVIIQPRKQKRVIWVLVFGGNHQIMLWEFQSAFNSTLKMWEKEPIDMLRHAGANLVRGKLLFQSNELTSIQWTDVNPKVQVLSAFENQYTGKILIKLALANHGSKSDIDIFDVQMLISYT